MWHHYCQLLLIKTQMLMFRNYLLIAFRNLQRQFSYSFINTPLSWYVMNKWLADFNSRYGKWELLALSMAAGLVVALATVSYHAIKASTINPAETLKYE